MTAKQKAVELIVKFWRVDFVRYKDAKQCALIAVDEIIKSNPIVPLQFMLESESLDKAIKFWKEVKHEIENL